MNRLIVTFLAFALCTGCVNLYRLESHGTVEVEGVERPSALYWCEEEGRLWYGRRHSDRDSSANLVICCNPPLSLRPASMAAGEVSGTGPITIESRSGDQLAARLGDEGDLVRQPPATAPRLARCAEVLVEGRPSSMEDLAPGLAPRVVVLCENPDHPARYPAVAAYPFDEIARSRIRRCKSPELVCEPAHCPR